MSLFQDMFTKWLMVYAVPNQKTIRIARLLIEQIIPFFRVPERLLSDCGTIFLSQLIMDLCEILGIKKINTTAYHPQCDGMIERFNHTLKSMLRKHAARFGNQWDRYLSGILWFYRNTPHDSTHENLHFCYLAWLVGLLRKLCFFRPIFPSLQIFQTTVKSL